MKKRILASLSVVLLGTSLLSACSNNDASNNTSNDTSSQNEYSVAIVQHAQHPALDAATKGFQEKLTKLIEADGKKVKFDYQNAAGEAANNATIVNTFVSNKVDLIMANATPSLQAATQGTTTIPILGTSVTDYASALEIDNWSGTTDINVSGTSDLAPLDKQADIFTELLPQAQKIGILYASSEANSAYQANEMKKLLEDRGKSVEFFTVADSNDIQTVVTNATQKIDALYIPTDNTIASSTTTVNQITSAAKIPVIAGEEGICKGAGIATLSIDYYQLGEKTAQMAYDILVKGQDPAKQEIQFADATTKKYVESRAQELNITIPSDYEKISTEE
ncbi:MAG: ABC transporter substrate-binding protein [Actinomycetaceae bacterium]|nr:ABC transporter substrate-binding protein [Actinomycetaceae bacterium]